MRELKFRAFCTTNNTYCFHGKGMTLRQISKLGDSYFQEDILWEQFTGYKAHDDVEIYEGDLLEGVDIDGYGTLVCKWIDTVKWSNERCRFYIESGDSQFGMDEADIWNERVVGTIHQPIKEEERA